MNVVSLSICLDRYTFVLLQYTLYVFSSTYCTHTHTHTAPAPAPVPAPVPVTAAPKQPLGTKMFPGGGSFNPIAARANLKKSTSAVSV